jgi:hypothetical protein
VTIPAGSSFAYIPVDITNDSSYEGTEQVQLTLNSNSNYTVGSNTTRTVTIYDNDPKPQLIDLSGDYFNVIKEPLEAGESFDSQFRIQNTEASNAGAFNVGFYLSTDSNITTSDKFLGNHYLSGLAGNSDTGTLLKNLTLPDASDSIWSQGDGNYYVGMVVDRYNQVSETNETNNSSNRHLGDYDAVYMSVPKTDESLIGVTWNGSLVELDTTTGSSTTIGYPGFSSLNSLAVDSQGDLYTIPDSESNTGLLIKINPQTGQGTIATTFNNDFNGVKASVRDLAFSNDGMLYGIHNNAGPGFIGEDSLFKLNPNTGEVTLIGDTGLSSLQSLAIASDGSLYSWDFNGVGLVKINPFTGVATDVNASLNSNENIQDLAFDYNGILYGAGEGNALYKIDPITGKATQVSSSTGVRGIAFVPKT